MGKRLSGKTQKDSLDSLQEFHRIHNFNYAIFNASVSVLNKKNKNLLFNKQIPIHVVFDNIDQFIDIMWEDANLEEYKAMNLFGRYNPSFNKMKIIKSRNLIEIHSSDSDKIVVVHY